MTFDAVPHGISLFASAALQALSPASRRGRY